MSSNIGLGQLLGWRDLRGICCICGNRADFEVQRRNNTLPSAKTKPLALIPGHTKLISDGSWGCLPAGVSLLVYGNSHYQYVRCEKGGHDVRLNSDGTIPGFTILEPQL